MTVLESDKSGEITQPQNAQAPGAGINAYEEAYQSIQRQSLDAAIDIVLARQGMDPQKVPKHTYDMIRLLNMKLNEINAKTQADIQRVQKAGGLEYNETIMDLNKLCLDLKVDQGVANAPPVKELLNPEVIRGNTVHEETASPSGVTADSKEPSQEAPK